MEASTRLSLLIQEGQKSFIFCNNQSKKPDHDENLHQILRFLNSGFGSLMDMWLVGKVWSFRQHLLSHIWKLVRLVEDTQALQCSRVGRGCTVGTRALLCLGTVSHPGADSQRRAKQQPGALNHAGGVPLPADVSLHLFCLHCASYLAQATESCVVLF